MKLFPITDCVQNFEQNCNFRVNTTYQIPFVLLIEPFEVSCLHTLYGQKYPDAYRHSVLEQSTIVTLEGSDWTNESDVTLLHIASTVRHAYLIYST
ncbi:hypothetical protein AVEN_268121-1 [Araneus ventricosus]|uniref:Uncharacterized protein n=1 Tax=Araneus ventricosus TaxID=182803 RepID=A0A4Y2RGV4_ARAVE|nr:hypothetical protein AVEN_268121-1 [Araneus ventricosus]